MLVGVDKHSLLSALHGHRDDLVLEAAALDGSLGFLLRPCGKRVLVLATHLELSSDVLGSVPHVAVVECAPESVTDHLVHQLTVDRAGSRTGRSP